MTLPRDHSHGSGDTSASRAGSASHGDGAGHSDGQGRNDGRSGGVGDSSLRPDGTAKVLGVFPFALLVNVAHRNHLAVIGALADSSERSREV